MFADNLRIKTWCEIVALVILMIITRERGYRNILLSSKIIRRITSQR